MPFIVHGVIPAKAGIQHAQSGGCSRDEAAHISGCWIPASAEMTPSVWMEVVTCLPVWKPAKEVEAGQGSRYCPFIESLGDAGHCPYRWTLP